MDKLTLLSGSTITQQGTIDAINKLAQASNSINGDIGDVNNFSGKSDALNGTLAGTLGNGELLAPQIPFGETITDFTENFSGSASHDFVLTLIPLTDVTITTQSGKSYEKVDKATMTNDSHYSIEGRRLNFYKNPEGQFSVTYKGKFPSIPGYEKYATNTYPNVASVASGKQPKSEVQKLDNTTYSVTIKPTTKIGDIGIPNGIQPSLPDKVKPYVDPNGTKEANPSDVSVWVKSDERYQRVSDAVVYLLSDSTFKFKTQMSLPSNPEIVLYVNGWTVSDGVGLLYKLFTSHAHNGEDPSALLSHSKLVGLIADRYVAGQPGFGVSKHKGDDHPHYFHRDGYTTDNPGNFNNAILGDVLIGSTNPGDMYNNTLDNSNKLFFGSVSTGASLMYDKDFQGIKLFGTNSGLRINTHGLPSEEKNLYATAIEFDGNKLYSTGDKGDAKNVLNIRAKDGLVKVSKTDEELAAIEAKSVSVQDASVSGTLATKGTGGIKVAKVDFRSNDGNKVEVSSEDAEASVEFKLPVAFDKLAAKSFNPTSIGISGDGAIKFGEEGANSIKSVDGAATVAGKKPLTIEESGKNTGIRYQRQEGMPFANVYVSAENGGQATQTDHDTYFETGNGDLYFLKDTTKVNSVLGTKYGFGELAKDGATRLDNLTLMPRANTFAGTGDFYTIKVKESSLKQRQGIHVGPDANIYATGADADCPPGWLVVESRNGVVFAETRAGEMNCSNLSYSEVTTGSLKVFGSASIDKNLGLNGNIDAGGYVSAESGEFKTKISTKEIEVAGNSRFTGKVDFTENVEINSGLVVGGSIQTKNRLEANELAVQSSAIFSGPATFSKQINIEGDIYSRAGFSGAGTISTTGSVNADQAKFNTASIGQLSVVNKLDARAGISGAGDFVTNGNLTADGDVTATNARYTGTATSGMLDVEKDASIRGDIYVGGKVQLNGDTYVGSDENDKLNVLANTTFNNNRNIFLGDVEISAPVSVKAELDVVGQSSFQSAIRAKAGLEVEGPINSKSSAEFTAVDVKDNISAAGNIYAKGDIVSDGQLRADKGATILGNSNIGQQGDNINISGDVIFGNEKSTFSGEVLMTDKVTISGETTLNSKVNVEGSIKAKGNLEIEGIANVKTIRADAQSEFKGGVIIDRQTEMYSAYIKDKAIIEKDLIVSGGLSLQGDITSVPSSTATLGQLNVSKGLTQIGSAEVNSFAGETRFNSTVSVSGKMSISGAIMTGSERSGVIIENNTIQMTGEASLIKADSMSVNSIRGDATKTVPITSSNAAMSREANNLSRKKFTTINNAYIEDSMVANGNLFCLGTLFVSAIEVVENEKSKNELNNKSVLNIIARRAKYAP
jgi:cytoskeletal protein CcmA (bactofilin family)